MKILWILFLGFVVWDGRVSEGAKILFLTPLGSKSHKGFFMAIAEELATAGHHVTMVSTHKPSKIKENIREIVLPAPDLTVFTEGIFDKGGAARVLRGLFFESPQFCVDGLATKEIQDLKKEKFDLVILSLFLSQCYASLAHHYQVPLIQASPAGLFGPFSTMSGSLHLSSLHKSELIEKHTTFPFSFWVRFQSTLIDGILDLLYSYYVISKNEQLCREANLCPPEMPSLRKINENASLYLLNSVKNFDNPVGPTMPNVVHLGGIHIHPAKPIPKDLEDFASSSKDGFILFSMGSAIHKPSDMPEKYRRILLNVFGSLKQNVIWKWDQEYMEGLPPNVKLGKWLPQQDLLGHKNMKLFITHGGLSSTLEASYHGVPIIGIPVFGDQQSNVAASVFEGWATMQKLETLEENSFRQLILHMMANKEYKKVAEQRSKIIRDLPRPVGEEAIYWIEYVLRHRGADHIKSPVLKLSIYELYNYDVWITLAGILVAFCFIIISCIKFTLKRCFGRPSRKRKRD